MTKRTPSEQAKVATIIRREIKKHGITAKVTSTSASMMTAVRVRVTDVTPATRRAIEAFAGQFQYGHFDGMVDMYEHSNTRDDIPQVKFVTVDVRYSDEMRAEVEAFCGGYWTDWASMSEADRDERVWRTMRDDKHWGAEFWRSRKPRVRAA